MMPLALSLGPHVAQQRRAMTGIFLGALVVAGLFIFLPVRFPPARIMHAVVFAP